MSWRLKFTTSLHHIIVNQNAETNLKRNCCTHSPFFGYRTFNFLCESVPVVDCSPMSASNNHISTRVIARLHSVRCTPPSLRTANPLLTIRKSRTFPNSAPYYNFLPKNFTSTATAKMSFSNADTGNKPEDPYKEKNKDEASLKEKVEDLVAFMDKCKFAMMTTRIESTGQLVSRCMALAAKVCISSPPFARPRHVLCNQSCSIFPSAVIPIATTLAH